ncbi:UNKNOWN [Stylonychia lemnae]|uniref:Cyclin N-terminal domain-containing protein n=1 Tax=Stylonychia lemnae TaxID=5949 RepID=A0A078B4X6_STYLE|nr:UNKNOWN [Stylonychia lemnae]|eukprot:CDW88588.1 UNKNOWN [Stylonychia lemnae]
MSKKLKLQAERNFFKLVQVLAQITHSIDAYQPLVDLSNRYHPIFEGNIRITQIEIQTETQLIEHQQLQIIQKLSFLKHLVPHQSFIIALLYIDRACQQNKTFLLNSQNVIRIAFACILIASKFIEEETKQENNILTSRGNLSNRMIIKSMRQIVFEKDELQKLEIQVLILIDFKAYVSKQEYDQYQKKLNQLFIKNNTTNKNQSQGEILASIPHQVDNGSE